MNLLLEVKLSPEEQDQYKQALAVLQDETRDEGIVDKLKKLLTIPGSVPDKILIISPGKYPALAGY